MTEPHPLIPKRRWYRLTPVRFLLGLLAVVGFLLLSEQFGWFFFNERTGWTVLVAVATVGCAVAVMLLWFAANLVLRRRVQFSFRSLLLFMVVLSVPLGWFAMERRRARRQQEAVEAILKVGGRVVYDYERDYEEARGPALLRRLLGDEETPGPARLRKLLGDDFFRHVVVVDCVLTGFADEDAVHLNELRHLEEMDLAATRVTDAGLQQLRDQTRLKVLSLWDTQVTDVGLGYLEGLATLEELYLVKTRVTDGGVRRLRRLLPRCEIHHPATRPG